MNHAREKVPRLDGDITLVIIIISFGIAPPLTCRLPESSSKRIEIVTEQFERVNNLAIEVFVVFVFLEVFSEDMHSRAEGIVASCTWSPFSTHTCHTEATASR